MLDRIVKTTRLFAMALSVLLASPKAGLTQAAATDEVVMRPVITEQISPVEAIAPVASDGHVVAGYVRKPPGDGLFPAVVVVHGGLIQLPDGILRDSVRNRFSSRFLELGYVVAVFTYRSRDEDYRAQTPQSVADALAALEAVKDLSFVDRDSVAVYGISGGGNLALEIAAELDIAAVAAEEPPAFLIAGLVTEETLAQPTGEVPWTELYHARNDNSKFRDQIARIDSPVFVLQSDEQTTYNSFNTDVLVSELRAGGTTVVSKTYTSPYGFMGHGFAYASETVAAVTAFEDIDAFFREHISTQPVRIDGPIAVEHVPAYQPHPRQVIDVQQHILADYVGTYTLPDGLPTATAPGMPMTLEVTLEDEQLMVEAQLGALRRKAPLFAESETFFFQADGNAPPVEFVRDNQGRVIGVMMGTGAWIPRE